MRLGAGFRSWYRDRFNEAWLGLSSRRLRSSLTAGAVGIGVAGYLTVVGVSSFTEAAVRERLNELRPTQIDLVIPDDSTSTDALIQDGLGTIDRLPGVVGTVGLSEVLLEPKPRASASWSPQTDGRPEATDVVVQAVEGDPATTLQAPTISGRWFDAGHNQRADQVVVLGPDLAETLKLTRVSTGAIVVIGGVPFTWIGVAEGFFNRPDLRSAAFIPRSAARTVWGPSVLQRRTITVRAAASRVPRLSEVVDLALRPDAPDAVSVSVPPDPTSLRRAVTSQLANLLVVLSVVVFLSGGLAIGAITLAGVLERRTEIGLRKALGARHVDVVSQFLCETIALGFLGGLAGAGVAAAALSVIAAVQGVAISLPWVGLMCSPFVGAAIGALAGIPPAWTAARIEPVEALNSSA